MHKLSCLHTQYDANLLQKVFVRDWE